MIQDKKTFYLLSFTWGILLTLVGCIVSVALLILGYKPKKWGYCYYFEVGEHWGGLELGPFFLVDKSSSTLTKNHEHGHAFQNCKLGLAMPFVVSIPSALRYWFRRIAEKNGKPCQSGYDEIWFEGEATKLGTEFMEWYNKETDNA